MNQPVRLPARHVGSRQRVPLASVRLFLAIFAAVLLSWSAAAAPPTIEELVAQFSPTNYLNIVSNKLYTQQGMNRNMWNAPEHDLCRDAIYTNLLQSGLTPYRDFFYYESNGIARYACNVIAVKEGVYNPSNEVFVVGSHYDSKNNPGADDNATGVACQLEMARIFAQYNFAKTIVFALFDGEEDYDTGGVHHRMGSVRYVNQHYNDNIRSMISVDMIGWQSPIVPNTATIAARPASASVSLDLQSALQTYGGLAVDLYGTGDNNSDHYPFEQAGFPACLLIEADHGNNVNYHKATDYVELPGYLHWGYLEKMCKSVIAYYAQKLQPVEVRPVVTSFEKSPQGTSTLLFSGLPGSTYVVDYAVDLSSNRWTAILTNQADVATGEFGMTHSPLPGNRSGFYRARFDSGYTGPSSFDVVVDNVDASVVGTWSTIGFSFSSSATNKFLSDSRYASVSASGTNYVEFRPNLRTNGQYAVYETHSTGSNRSTNAPVIINHSGGTQTNFVNQQLNNGAWVFLGTFSFAAGTNGYVRVRNNATSGSSTIVIADAIKFVYGAPVDPGTAPQLASQPRNTTVDLGATATFSGTATGTAPLSYRWYFNGSLLPGAIGSTHTVLNAQTNNAGSYFLVVSNAYGMVTSRVATLTVYSAQSTLFADNFDSDTSMNWVSSASSADTAITFNYNYSADGIPPAPHSADGTTRGVKFEANMTAPNATAAVSIAPLGYSFAGDYRLRFDMWINANGPFPNGGTGSTEHITCGVGTTGDHVQWTNDLAADGYWFAVDGEGNATTATPDYCAYIGSALQTASSGVYAAGTASNSRDNVHPYYTAAFPGEQTPPAWQRTNYLQQTGALAPGTIGFTWCDVVVEKRGNMVEWFIDGVKLATISNATFTANNVFVGYWDQFSSVSSNPALSFGLVDNVRVEVPAP